MELTTKQAKGLDIAIERYRLKEKFTIISGYAGSGKSTLVQFIVEALLNETPDLKNSDIGFCAYTGKAAEALRSKGIPAVTAHSLLYDTHMNKDGTYTHKKKSSIDYKIVIVDEISMLPYAMLIDLLKFNIYMIGLGDPFQLPPINPKDNNHLLDNPHIMLDEIVRQAKESDIIRLTMQIREGKPIMPIESKEIKVLNRCNLTLGMVKWADQILCATNKKRREINTLIRQQAYGYPDYPVNGDKVVCLSNYWDTASIYERSPLVNGTTGILDDIADTPYVVPINNKWLELEGLSGNIKLFNNDYFYKMVIDKNRLISGESSLSPEESYKLNKMIARGRIAPFIELDYGYCLSVHKAQGSQWDKVVVIEEQFPTDKLEHYKHLYTACTRAIKQLVLIKK